MCSAISRRLQRALLYGFEVVLNASRHTEQRFEPAGSTKWESRGALTIQWDYLSVYALRHYRADNLAWTAPDP
jgi:hypothetical protein